MYDNSFETRNICLYFSYTKIYLATWLYSLLQDKTGERACTTIKNKMQLVVKYTKKNTRTHFVRYLIIDW